MRLYNSHTSAQTSVWPSSLKEAFICYIFVLTNFLQRTDGNWTCQKFIVPNQNLDPGLGMRKTHMHV